MLPATLRCFINYHMLCIHHNLNSLFFIGIQQADEQEMKLMASTPHRSHIYSVADFDSIKNVQKEFITQVCAGVDDQLSSLVSGLEGEMCVKEIPHLSQTFSFLSFQFPFALNLKSVVQLILYIAGS